MGRLVVRVPSPLFGTQGYQAFSLTEVSSSVLLAAHGHSFPCIVAQKVYQQPRSCIVQHKGSWLTTNALGRGVVFRGLALSFKTGSERFRS